MIAISRVEACDGDSLVVHCASLLRTIFASLARANERVHVRNERNFPQAKLDSELDKCSFSFIIRAWRPIFLLHNNSVCFNLLESREDLKTNCVYNLIEHAEYSVKTVNEH